MSRTCSALLVCLGSLLLCGLSVVAADIEVPAIPPPEVVVEHGGTPNVTPGTSSRVSITTAALGNLFRAGDMAEVVLHIANAGPERQATITLSVTTGLGCPILSSGMSVTLPENGTLDQRLPLEGSNHFPHGSYRVDAWVVSAEKQEIIGYGTTLVSIWAGPAEKPNDFAGISYLGALDSERTWKDLDLFQLAGIGWLRFPLHGWLPQGQAIPPEAETYNLFVQEASKRGFPLLAAFTPKTTVDASVNPVQADKEYRESLLAAAARYGFKVKYWDLLRVKPDPNYPGLKGIGFSQLALGRQALRGVDKSLHGVFSLQDPFKYDALDLYNHALPAKDDVVGMTYDFIGVPEIAANTTPPRYALGDVASQGKQLLKRTPPVWVTEYGFDATKRLPRAIYQAALISRALILDRAQGFQRVFWRHDVAGERAVPFTDSDGGVEPSLLAIRTTLQALQGVTQISELPIPMSDPHEPPLHAFLLKIGGEKKRKDPNVHYILAVWKASSGGEQTAVTLKTRATQVTVTDLWGGIIELRPTSGVAVFPVDEFPRFIDVGWDGQVELTSPFAHFRPGHMVLQDGKENRVVFRLSNDQRFFAGRITCDIYFRRWPNPTEVKVEKVTDLSPGDYVEIPRALTIPDGAQQGQVYEVSADIMLGARRIGYVVLPVLYSPVQEKPTPPVPGLPPGKP